MILEERGKKSLNEVGTILKSSPAVSFFFSSLLHLIDDETESHYKGGKLELLPIVLSLPLATSSAFSHGKTGGEREYIEYCQHNSRSPLFSFMLYSVPRSSSITLSSALCIHAFIFRSFDLP